MEGTDVFVGSAPSAGSVEMEGSAPSGFEGTSGSVISVGSVCMFGPVVSVGSVDAVVPVGSGGTGMDTVTVQEAVFPPSLVRTVITAEPFDLAVTRPVEETVATVGSED